MFRTFYLDLITNLIENEEGVAKTTAQAILQYAYDQVYCNCPQPSGSAGTKSSMIGFDDYQKAFGAKVSAEPNPAGE